MLIKLAATEIAWEIAPYSLQQTKIHVQLAHAACSRQKSMYNWPMQLAADKNPCTIGPCGLQRTKIHVQLARAACSGQKSMYNWPIQLEETTQCMSYSNTVLK